MPEYQYKCTLCNTKFSVFRSMNDEWIVYCPKCRSEHIMRLFSDTPVIFNGKGFYKTDSQKPLTNEE